MARAKQFGFSVSIFCVAHLPAGFTRSKHGHLVVVSSKLSSKLLTKAMRRKLGKRVFTRKFGLNVKKIACNPGNLDVLVRFLIQKSSKQCGKVESSYLSTSAEKT